MKVIVVEPMEKPVVKEIGSKLEDMQEVVGGLIEAVYPYDDLVALVCNEEGKINGSPLNRLVYDQEGKLIDVIAGTFFICGLSKDNFCGLSDELVEKYLKVFEHTYYFVR